MARFMECALGCWLDCGAMGCWVIRARWQLCPCVIAASLSLGLLWCRSGISTISALTRFCFNPSTSVTKVANPLTFGCSLLGYDLFLSLIGAFFVALPIGKHLGATAIASIVQSRPWVLFYSLPCPKNSSGGSLLDTLKSTLPSRVCSLHCLWSVGCY